MANQETTFNGDLFVNGAFRAKTASLPSSSITNSNVVAGAGISASKLQHQHQHVYAQEGTNASASARQILHVVVGATGTVESIKATLTTACIGAATITVDLKKNGTTILSAVISFSSSDAAFTLKAGTISTPAVVVGDVLEIVVVATAGGGTLGKGIAAVLKIREDAD